MAHSRISPQMSNRPLLPEPFEVTLLVTTILESLAVPYAIVGSMAGTIYGRIRTTMDVDLVVDLHSDQVEQFIQRLGELFYFDVQADNNAVLTRTNFNLIHLETMFKVDIFIPKTRAFDQQLLSRRLKSEISSSTGRRAYFVTAEDLILAKLDWHRLTGGASEHQWQDVLSIIQIQDRTLDQDYLHQWAKNLKILKLLEHVLLEAHK